MGATWWQGRYGVPPPPTQVSTRLAHIQLTNSPFHPLGALPGGRYGRHLVADMGATWWQGSYGVYPPPTRVSTQLAHRRLRKSNFVHRRTDRRSSHIFIDNKGKCLGKKLQCPLQKNEYYIGIDHRAYGSAEFKKDTRQILN